jgi:hypothetical protein
VALALADQMGAGRAGWYSYDWIDNGGHPTANSIRPEYQQVAPGDVMPATPGMADAFCVTMIQPPRDLVIPLPPVRRMHIDWRVCLRLYPTAKDTAARKYERMDFIGVDNRQFEIAPEGRACYRPPFHLQMIR